MSNDPKFTVRRARWPEDASDMQAIRAVVFIDEQNVPPELEWDGTDDACLHAIAFDGDDIPCGTGRLTADGKIGRMAVLKQYRGHGIGRAIMRQLLAIAADQGIEQVTLGAQTHAIGFYEELGFTAYGEIFDDAGMPHRSMRMSLTSS